MKTLCGKILSSGLAMGKAFIYQDILQRDLEQYEIAEHKIEEELSRIREAISEVAGDLDKTAGVVGDQLGPDQAAIFTAQKELLRDATLLREVTDELKNRLVNAEEVVKSVFRRMEHRFRSRKEPVFRDRGDDIADIGRRVLRALIGIHVNVLERVSPGTIVVARRLLPSDTAVMSQKSVAGVVVEFGGPGSHAAILTREMGVPALSQIENATQEISDGDCLLLDGFAGQVTVNPDVDAKRVFTARMEVESQTRIETEVYSHKASCTSDGTPVAVFANAGCREDIVAASEKGAEGIGLYRVEGFFLASKRIPTDDELYRAMKTDFVPMAGKPITFRLLDIGGDKLPQFLRLPYDDNPFLGVRGVRLLLQHPELLKTQLRGVFRLSQDHDIRILIPMVTVASDVVRIRELLQTSASEAGVRKLPALGAMIETPAAALCASDIAKVSDFLSIGTNDLTQYTMAAGRENPCVSEYFAEDHPAVLKLVELVVQQAGDVPVSICGELASHLDMTERLLLLGLRSLSVAPSVIPALKARIRQIALCPSRSEQK